MPSLNRTAAFKREVTKRGRPPTPPQPLREEFTKLSSSLHADLLKMNVFFSRTYAKYINALVFSTQYTHAAPHPTASKHKDIDQTITSKGREEFDDTMIAFLRQCKGKLHDMRTIATRDPSQNKVHSYHRQQVALDLEQRLTHLAMAYDRMIKHAASETMRVSITLDMGSDRSEDDGGAGGAGAGALRKRHTRKRWPTVRTAANIETKGASSVPEVDVGRRNVPDTDANPSSPTTVASSEAHLDDATPVGSASGDLSNTFLEQESLMLERNLSTNLDVTKQIESQFIELANMTKMFTSQVEEQHDQVQTIAEDTEDALDYVESGLDELNKAKSGTSKYFLSFVFVLLSFIVLFLDWWSY
jgi:hypothetical protein